MGGTNVYAGVKEVLQAMVGIRDTDGYRVVWGYRTLWRTIDGYAGLQKET